MPWLNACSCWGGGVLRFVLDCDWCASTTSVVGRVVLPGCVERRSELFTHLVACFDCARGAVPGIRRSDGGKSGLPQPPVAFFG